MRNKILALLFVGVLMAALDIAIIGPALPSIQATFGVDERALTWVFSIYVLMNLVGTPLMAKLSDIYGRRNIYVMDVALFGLGSAIVLVSPSFGVLLLGRAIQGLGAGGIFPVAAAVIGDTFPPEKRGGALGLIGAVFGLAFIVGPILGGDSAHLGLALDLRHQHPHCHRPDHRRLVHPAHDATGGTEAFRLAGHGHVGYLTGIFGLWAEPDRHPGLSWQPDDSAGVALPAACGGTDAGLLAARKTCGRPGDSHSAAGGAPDQIGLRHLLWGWAG